MTLCRQPQAHKSCLQQRLCLNPPTRNVLSSCPRCLDQLVSHQNEAAVVDVLWNALADMLKEREGPSTAHASCNGPVSREAQASNMPPDPNNETGREGGEEEGGAERTIVPEDRSAAAELLRKGEQRVLQKCLDWVEVRRHFAWVSSRCIAIVKARTRGTWTKKYFPSSFGYSSNCKQPPQ